MARLGEQCTDYGVILFQSELGRLFEARGLLGREPFTDLETGWL